MGDQYQKQIEEALGKNKTVVLAANCSVHYSGRAESFLDFGDRIIMIKSDNTIIVHQEKGNAPVNYMKPGTACKLSKKKDSLQIYADHQANKEFMDIRIKDIHFCNTHKLEDTHNIVLEGTEKDMSDMIYENPECIEQGFKTVSQEEQTKYGFVDVLGYDKNEVLCVVECKRYTGDFKAVDQLRRYVEKIKDSKGIDRVRGILACPKMTPNASKMLEDFGFTHARVEAPKRNELFNKAQLKLDSF